MKARQQVLRVFSAATVVSVLLVLACETDNPNKTGLPTVTTAEVDNITSNDARCGGDVTADGGTEVTAKGIVWDTVTAPTLQQKSGFTNEGAGLGTFTSNLGNLLPEKDYYVRAYATNSKGTAYGEVVHFVTLTAGTVPSLFTAGVDNITQTSATGGGAVTADGGSLVIARGVCWSTTSNPSVNGPKTVDGMGNGAFSSIITGLQPNTGYYVRAYAVNSTGVGYGNIVWFSTSP